MLISPHSLQGTSAILLPCLRKQLSKAGRGGKDVGTGEIFRFDTDVFSPIRKWAT